ncbi:MAG: tetratricopeptide repeat protein [bacterium]
MRQQDWQKAQSSLDEYLKKNPRDGEAHLLLAEVFGELDSIQAMRRTLTTLRQISPKYENSAVFLLKKYWTKNFNRGLKLFQLKNYRQAANQFGLAVQIDKSQFIGLQKLADALFMAGRYYEAQTAYQQALNMQPDNLILKNNLAEIYFIKKQYQKSVNLCNEILNKHELEINALMRRAYAYDALKNYSEAVKDFERLIELSPTPKLLTDFGMLHFRQQEYHKAIDYFTAALADSSNNYLLYRYLGEANWRVRNYQDMVTWYRKIVESSPDDLLGWKNLALAYEALGKKQLLVEARNHIDKITRTN